MGTTHEKTATTTCYTAQSCHELGYDWALWAPSSLQAEEVERLQAALTAWSDTPEQADLEAMLGEEWFCTEHELTNLQELRKVTFTAKIVHGDRWTQGFRRAG